MDVKLLHILEQGGICQMLCVFLDNPSGTSKNDFRKPPLNLDARAINRNLLALYSSRLIEVVPNTPKVIHRLTEKGKVIAVKVKEILTALENEGKK